MIFARTLFIFFIPSFTYKNCINFKNKNIRDTTCPAHTASSMYFKSIMSEPKLNGLILHYSLLTHRGVISDEHANRYAFCLTQCQVDFELKRGMKVQFKLNEKQTVTEIYRTEFTAFAQK